MQEVHFSLQVNLHVFIYLFLKFIYFIYLFLATLGLHCYVWAFSSCREWGLLLLKSTGSRCRDFSSCGTWAQQLWLTGSRVQTRQLWCTDLVAPWHVGSSWTRARTSIPCTGRRILNHSATREVLHLFLTIYFQVCIRCVCVREREKESNVLSFLHSFFPHQFFLILCIIFMPFLLCLLWQFEGI